MQIYKLYEVMLIRLMSKIEYLNRPKETKFTELGKLGFRCYELHDRGMVLSVSRSILLVRCIIIPISNLDATIKGGAQPG